jgi:hypothetical protein
LSHENGMERSCAALAYVSSLPSTSCRLPPADAKRVQNGMADFKLPEA